MEIEYPTTEQKVTNPLDLNEILVKIEAGAYSCCEAFWADLKWIAHNVKIHYSGKKFSKLKFYEHNSDRWARFCL